MAALVDEPKRYTLHPSVAVLWWLGSSSDVSKAKAEAFFDDLDGARIAAEAVEDTPLQVLAEMEKIARQRPHLLAEPTIRERSRRSIERQFTAFVDAGRLRLVPRLDVEIEARQMWRLFRINPPDGLSVGIAMATGSPLIVADEPLFLQLKPLEQPLRFQVERLTTYQSP